MRCLSGVMKKQGLSRMEDGDSSIFVSERKKMTQNESGENVINYFI